LLFLDSEIISNPKRFVIESSGIDCLTFQTIVYSGAPGSPASVTRTLTIFELNVPITLTEHEINITVLETIGN